MRGGAILPATLFALGLAACGAGAQRGGDRPRLTVSAAASLTGALTACSRDFPGADVRLSFAGSDELAAQIRRGARPDVFAAANTRLPEQLRAEALLRDPVVFAGNELVVAVPADSEVRRVEDLGRPDTTVVAGAPSVPVGAYTRAVLGRLPGPVGRAILANIRSNEPDVKGVVAKLTQGAADGGFVYRTDVAATPGRLRAVALPRRLEPRVAYGAGVVAAAREPEAARSFVDDLVGGRCAAALRRAGFAPGPRG